MTSIVRWDDESLRGKQAGRPLVIVGTGPSFDNVDHDAFRSCCVFALNAAITEFVGHSDVWWVCHDLFKIWRHDFRSRIRGYRRWRLVTRRCYVPGKFGDVRYRMVGGGSSAGFFDHRMSQADLARCDPLSWYAELEGQEGYLRADETVLEIALCVAAAWGFAPICLVGIDLSWRDGNAYAAPWRWKKCHLRPDKLSRIKACLKARRGEWPARIYSLPSRWKGCPFDSISSVDWARMTCENSEQR